MESSNLDAIRKSFEIQAGNFETTSMNFSKKEYLDYTVECMALSETDAVLEVASGTCACGRAIAPFVRTVTCLDTTTAMLEVGKAEAQKNGLNNMVFVIGNAEELPFLNDSFDVVLSRLAFHHFPNPNRVFSEMARTLKPGGKLVVIDMEATEESLRYIEDEIETMRDPSHVKNLNIQELTGLFADHAINITRSEITRIPVALDAWMELTQTPIPVQNTIRQLMEADLNGESKTGFFPFRKEGKIYFEQRWRMIIGEKSL